MKVSICLISTRRYHVFVQPLIDSICKYFLLRHQIEINLFTDEIREIDYVPNCDRITVIQELIPSYKFPEATLYRYAIMTSKKYNCDYMYYLDVDMLLVSEVGDEVFGSIVAVEHPGFSVVGGGSWGNNKASTSYTFPEYRIKYFAGGYSGGEYEKYYDLMKQLKRNIDEDEKNGVRAEHNDETHFNKALSERKDFKILNAGYCMVEQQYLREAWLINNLPVFIIALAKNHSDIRS